MRVPDTKLWRLAVAVLALAGSVASLVVRTPLTQAYVQQYARSHQPVSSGGWHALEQAAMAELSARQWAAVRPDLPEDLDVVRAGGWYALQQAAVDPKGLLLRMVQEQLQGQSAAEEPLATPERLYAVVALLQAQGKGFDSDLIDGEWTLVLQKQGRRSPKFQKLVATRERPGTTEANFDVGRQQFTGSVRLLRGLGLLRSRVQYKPVADNFDVSTNNGKKVVLRRIACDIVGASWKFWKLPTVPLPLRKKGGYLDFVYLDQDLRVTKGSRGGLFVHARPACLERLLST